jgi:hypothetical protein
LLRTQAQLKILNEGNLLLSQMANSDPVVRKIPRFTLLNQIGATNNDELRRSTAVLLGRKPTDQQLVAIRARMETRDPNVLDSFHTFSLSPSTAAQAIRDTKPQLPLMGLFGWRPAPTNERLEARVEALDGAIRETGYPLPGGKGPFQQAFWDRQREINTRLHQQERLIAEQTYPADRHNLLAYALTVTSLTFNSIFRGKRNARLQPDSEIN